MQSKLRRKIADVFGWLVVFVLLRDGFVSACGASFADGGVSGSMLGLERCPPYCAAPAGRPLALSGTGEIIVSLENANVLLDQAGAAIVIRLPYHGKRIVARLQRLGQEAQSVWTRLSEVAENPRLPAGCRRPSKEPRGRTALYLVIRIESDRRLGPSAPRFQRGASACTTRMCWIFIHARPLVRR